MERLYKRLIPVSNGGDFFVFGVRALCAFGAYERRRRAICFCSTCHDTRLQKQIRPLGSPMGVLPIRLAYFLPRYTRRDVG